MIETLLSVEHDTETGVYVVNYAGRKLSLATCPRFDVEYSYPGAFSQENPKWHFEFSAYDFDPTPPPKPKFTRPKKRSAAKGFGLDKPTPDRKTYLGLYEALGEVYGGKDAVKLGYEATRTWEQIEQMRSATRAGVYP